MKQPQTYSHLAEYLRIPPVFGISLKQLDSLGAIITGIFALFIGTTLQQNRPYWVYATMDYPIARIGILFLIFLLAWNGMYLTAIFSGISYAMILDDVSKIVERTS
jgi:hypothetical protein